MTPSDIQVGEFLIRRTETYRGIEGETTSGVATSGVAELFDVSGRGANVEVGFVRWQNGEEDVRQLRRLAGPEPVDGITDRLRMTIYDSGDESWCECEQAWVDKSGRVRKRMASLEEIDVGGGISSAEVLKPLLGRIGTREMLRHDEGQRRNRLCVVFPAEERIVPVAVFVMSRLAPVVPHAGVRQR